MRLWNLTPFDPNKNALTFEQLYNYAQSLEQRVKDDRKVIKMYHDEVVKLNAYAARRSFSMKDAHLYIKTIREAVATSPKKLRNMISQMMEAEDNCSECADAHKYMGKASTSFDTE